MRHGQTDKDIRRACIISFLSSRQVLRRFFLFAVTTYIYGAKWRRSGISREAKMPRVTVNHPHRHLHVLPRTFVSSPSRPTQLLLQHQVLHIQHSPRSCQESMQHWDPAHTHHIMAYRHPPAHPTSLSRARRRTAMSNGLGRRRRIANNESRAPRSPCWPAKLYSRSWEARFGTRSAAILPPRIHIRLRRPRLRR